MDVKLEKYDSTRKQIGKAELEVKYTVAIMEDRFEVRIESGDNKFNSVSANAKEGGGVIKNGTKSLDSLHILFSLNNM